MPSFVTVDQASWTNGLILGSFKSDLKLNWSVIYYWRRRQYFFSREPWSKTWVYVMIDFICMGLLQLQGAQTENYKVENYSPQRNSNSRLLNHKVTTVTIKLSDRIHNRKFEACNIQIFLWWLVIPPSAGKMLSRWMHLTCNSYHKILRDDRKWLFQVKSRFRCFKKKDVIWQKQSFTNRIRWELDRNHGM